jgi:hypothetical protein
VLTDAMGSADRGLPPPRGCAKDAPWPAHPPPRLRPRPDRAVRAHRRAVVDRAGLGMRATSDPSSRVGGAFST